MNKLTSDFRSMGDEICNWLYVTICM